MLMLSVFLLLFQIVSGAAYRLPRSVIPLHYTIIFEFIEEKYCSWQRGTVEIDIFCQETTNTIALHWNDLDFQNAKLKCSAGQELDEPILIPTNEIIRFSLTKPLMPGDRCTLKLKFQWRRQGDSKIGPYGGFHQQFYLVTLFSRTGARMMFPCFDEPSFKATFKLYLRLKKEFTETVRVTHNTPLIGQHQEPSERLLLEFDTTPIMSTYLFAITISNISIPFYQHRSPDLVVEVIGLKSEQQLSKTAFAIGLVDEFFANEFDFRNPLRKISYVMENPADYTAMENWGLIIGNFDFLVHELAHTWTGNLVTNEFWDDIWLNEGITHFFTGIAYDRLLPEAGYKKTAEFFWIKNWLESGRLARMHSWALSGDHFINLEAYYYYTVGPTILRMLEGIMGYNSLLKAMRRYIKAYAYRTAKTADFLHILDQVAHEDGVEGWIPGRPFQAAKFMNSWIYQENYPIITVEQRKGRFHLRQSCVLGSKEHLQWPIPIWWTASEKQKLNWLLPGQELILKIPNEPVVWDPEVRCFCMFNKTYETVEELLKRPLPTEFNKSMIPDYLSSSMLSTLGDSFNKEKQAIFSRMLLNTNSSFAEKLESFG